MKLFSKLLRQRVLPVQLLVLLFASWLVAPAWAQETVREIRFSEFFRMPSGPKGLELGDTLLQANGQMVRLVGYMVQQEAESAGRFLLTPQPVQMSQHADGEADDLPASAVLVVLDGSQQDWSVTHVKGLIAVQGVLSVGRYEAADGRIFWLRLQLHPDALRPINSLELAGYLHSRQHRH